MVTSEAHIHLKGSLFPTSVMDLHFDCISAIMYSAESSAYKQVHHRVANIDLVIADGEGFQCLG